MDSRQRVVREPDVQSTVADFVAAHGGDGPGLYTIGFGCDGTPFSMDQLRVGAPGAVTTYDLEGLRTVVSISRHRVDADDAADADADGDGDGEVTITGRLRTETGDPIPHATMILERRNPDSRFWKPVLVAEVRNGGVSATVPADERAFYRWRFVERPLAEGNASMALLLDIVPTLPTGSPSPTPSSTPSPTQSPSDPSSPSAPDSTDSTSAPASESSSGSPTQSASQSPSQSATLSESATVSTASPVDASDEAAPSGSSTP
jgi:hypothetical protein